MTLPTWNTISIVKVDAKPSGLWTLAVEYVPPSRLLRLRVVDKDESQKTVGKEWNRSQGTTCGPDGDQESTTKTGILCSTASVGALIAKLGGSTADVPDSTPGTTSPYTGKKVFPVGSFCIVAVTIAADAGPLFLTINDTPDAFNLHSGALYVEISVAPI